MKNGNGRVWLCTFACLAALSMAWSTTTSVLGKPAPVCIEECKCVKYLCQDAVLPGNPPIPISDQVEYDYRGCNYWWLPNYDGAGTPETPEEMNFRHQPAGGNVCPCSNVTKVHGDEWEEHQAFETAQDWTPSTQYTWCNTCPS